jgi:hypothetical protein
MNYNIVGNVEHDEHMMVVLYNYLGGRSVGENMAESSSVSPHATRIPGALGWISGNPTWDHIANIREYVVV